MVKILNKYNEVEFACLNSKLKTEIFFLEYCSGQTYFWIRYCVFKHVTQSNFLWKWNEPQTEFIFGKQNILTLTTNWSHFNFNDL